VRGGPVLVADVEAIGAELGDGGVHVPSVEQHQGVEDQTQGADLVLHAVLVALVELSGPAVEDFPGERVAALLRLACTLIWRRYPGSSARRRMCRVLAIRP
jgi:hypothetical protein